MIKLTMTIENKNSKPLLFLILSVSMILCGAVWANEVTSVGGADPGEAGGEIFKSEGNVDLKCTTGGLPPVEGVKVSCNNPSGASLCNGPGSSGGGKNKVASKKSSPKGGTTGIQVSRVMFDCLNKIIPICAKKAGCSGKGIKIDTMGGHADRVKNTMKGGSKSPSKHCGGFAIDFSSIQCSGVGGGKLELTKPGRAKDKDSYDGFRSCWDKEVEEKCKPLKQAINKRFNPGVDYMNSFYSLFLSLVEPAYAGKSGKHSIACVGAPSPQNAKHNDHMHGSVDSPTGQPSGI